MKQNWWEQRYARGGSSGKGSVGKGRTWKWSIIDEYIQNVEYVVDVGCGDLTFWEGRSCRKYVGIDVSKTVIEKNRLARPGWSFIHANATEKQDVKGRIVFCLDLLFHIMNSEDFPKILENLCAYSEEWIFIHTWSKNPFMDKRSPHYQRGVHKVTDGKYQHYRSLTEWLHIFEKAGFKLVATRKRAGGTRREKLGIMFIFRKTL